MDLSDSRWSTLGRAGSEKLPALIAEFLEDPDGFMNGLGWQQLSELSLSPYTWEGTAQPVLDHLIPAGPRISNPEHAHEFWCDVGTAVSRLGPYLTDAVSIETRKTAVDHIQRLLSSEAWLGMESGILALSMAALSGSSIAGALDCLLWGPDGEIELECPVGHYWLVMLGPGPVRAYDAKDKPVAARFSKWAGSCSATPDSIPWAFDFAAPCHDPQWQREFEVGVATARSGVGPMTSPECGACAVGSVLNALGEDDRSTRMFALTQSMECPFCGSVTRLLSRLGL